MNPSLCFYRSWMLAACTAAGGVFVSQVAAAEGAPETSGVRSERCYGSGSVRGIEQAIVRSPVSGTVSLLLVNTSDVVRKGQQLVVLNRNELDHSLVEEKRSLLTQGEAELRRARAIRSKGMLAESAVERLETEVHVLRAKLKRAVSAWESGLVLSHADGTVALVEVGDGQYVSEGEPLLQVEVDRPAVVDAWLPGRCAPFLRIGSKVQINSPFGQPPATATVTAVGQALEHRVGRVRVFAELVERRQDFRPGLPVEIGFIELGSSTR